MPNVFISHGREDTEFATRLCASLKSQGLEAWTDENDLEPGIKWANAIEEAISNSNNVLFVLSDKTKRSSWLQAEAAMALAQGGKRVIPIYCTKQAEVPFILRPFKGMDFSDVSLYSEQMGRLTEVLSSDAPDSDVEIEQDASAQEQIVKLQTSLFEQEMAQHEELERWKARMFKFRLIFVATTTVIFTLSIGIVISALPTEIVTEVITGATGITLGLVLGLALNLFRRIKKGNEGSE